MKDATPQTLRMSSLPSYPSAATRSDFLTVCTGVFTVSNSVLKEWKAIIFINKITSSNKIFYSCSTNVNIETHTSVYQEAKPVTTTL